MAFFSSFHARFSSFRMQIRAIILMSMMRPRTNHNNNYNYNNNNFFHSGWAYIVLFVEVPVYM